MLGYLPSNPLWYDLKSRSQGVHVRVHVCVLCAHREGDREMELFVFPALPLLMFDERGSFQASGVGWCVCVFVSYIRPPSLSAEPAQTCKRVITELKGRV